ncbi:hypothetical protein J2Y48_001114 [Mycoplana sp. BE70]|uniref:hypothetical protein n=1 Tax=Mycoplana sp. BE70 TaxID=2817775 RepID=UPI0028600D64|nr:hypothetical protein [Mycoplana sp. BE70]MDR6755829.1 hypothetical protein [Mycoplana sp. BE70]
MAVTDLSHTNFPGKARIAWRGVEVAVDFRSRSGKVCTASLGRMKTSIATVAVARWDNVFSTSSTP